MSERDDESELDRAMREADEAEARLQREKERLIPRDRVDALNDLLRAEAVAMMSVTTRRFEAEIAAATSEDEVRAVLERMSHAMIEGTARVEATVLEQMRAWTLAGIEDRAAGDAHRERGSS